MIQGILFLIYGAVVGIFSSFMGVGGGILIIPLLLMLGYTPQKVVGTSFMVILFISLSALLAHNKLGHIDYKIGALLGIGGILGAQFGAVLVKDVSPEVFKKIFAVFLVVMGIYLFTKK